MVKVSAGQKSSNLARDNIVVEMLKAFKRGVHNLFSLSSRYGSLKVERNLLGFVQEAWRYPFVIIGKNTMHIRKVYGNPS